MRYGAVTGFTTLRFEAWDMSMDIWTMWNAPGNDESDQDRAKRRLISFVTWAWR